MQITTRLKMKTAVTSLTSPLTPKLTCQMQSTLKILNYFSFDT